MKSLLHPSFSASRRLFFFGHALIGGSSRAVAAFSIGVGAAGGRSGGMAPSREGTTAVDAAGGRRVDGGFAAAATAASGVGVAAKSAWRVLLSCPTLPGATLLLPHGQNAGQATIEFHAAAESERSVAFEGLEICLWEGQSPADRDPLVCLAAPSGTVGLSHLGVGTHTFSAAVRIGGEAALLSSPAVLDVRVVEQEAFVPSYEWQPVLAWESVPAGLEVRMPMDGSGKTARIPPTWRLQLWVESAALADRGVSGFFYRDDLTEFTPLSHLCAMIAQQVERELLRKSEQRRQKRQQKRQQQQQQQHLNGGGNSNLASMGVEMIGERRVGAPRFKIDAKTGRRVDTAVQGREGGGQEVIPAVRVLLTLRGEQVCLDNATVGEVDLFNRQQELGAEVRIEDPQR